MKTIPSKGRIDKWQENLPLLLIWKPLGCCKIIAEEAVSCHFNINKVRHNDQGVTVKTQWSLPQQYFPKEKIKTLHTYIYMY